MSKHKPESKELGFGQTAGNQARLMNSAGTYNYQKTGLSWAERIHFYRWLTTCSLWTFLGLVFLGFFLINILFTGIYYLIGLDQLSGMTEIHPWRKFVEVFSFSMQTATTVGYGRINPTGVAANFVAMFQVVSGIIYTALITGLVYGRFSKPKNGIWFSENAVFAPFGTGLGLMLRLVNSQSSSLMTAKVTVSIGYLAFDSEGKPSRHFENLNLERDTISFFASNWTIVHPIDENSIFNNKTVAEIDAMHVELFILFTAYDEVFNSIIHARRSYAESEIKYGYRFLKMSQINEQGTPIVDVSKLSDIEKVDLLT
jgi:inward rectifier potassium channel